jgi:hypothetical protein
MNPLYKYGSVFCGIIYEKAPWTVNCNSPGDSTQKIVDKIDDVCGCTLNHEVVMDTGYPYWDLRIYPLDAPICKPSYV